MEIHSFLKYLLFHKSAKTKVKIVPGYKLYPYEIIAIWINVQAGFIALQYHCLHSAWMKIIVHVCFQVTLSNCKTKEQKRIMKTKACARHVHSTIQRIRHFVFSD